MEDLVSITERLAKLAGQYAQLHQKDLREWSKANDHRNIVTSVDLEISELLKSEIAKKFPEDRFYSEEEITSLVGSGRIWIIDPIDGTANYARMMPWYSCCVAAMQDGAVVAGSIFAPALGECFSFGSSGATLNSETISVRETTTLKDAYVNFHPGRNSQHRTWASDTNTFFLERAKKILNVGSSALDLAYVACGRFDVVVYGTLTTADVASAIGLVRCAGGEVYQYETGKPVVIHTEPQRIIAVANQELFNELWSAMPK